MNLRSLTPRIAFAALSLLGVLPAASGQVLTSQEQAIANDMINDPGQTRSNMVLDPIIEQVARARARDMAVRGYFSHVNPDGVAANYLLRQAGYVLPAWWGTDPAANYVESIAAGYSDPASTWNAWMNSPEHKTHLLALNPFYTSETHYGVGYYADPGSTYGYYWVVITAPPQPAPPLSILAPANGATIHTDSVGISGTADLTHGAVLVQYRIENTSGTSAYQPATGVATWSATAASLLPGQNTIRVQSLDAGHKVLAQAVCTVDYIVLGTLAVSTSGSGSVTSAYAGVTTQPVGSAIVLKATPATGSVFTGWTGTVTSSNATLSFAMADGITEQAHFIPSPFAGLATGYYGALASGSTTTAGAIRVAMTASGAFTGRLQYGARGVAFAGRFNAQGQATVVVPLGRGVSLTIALQVDLSGNQVSGSVSDGTVTCSFSATGSTFNTKTNIAPEAGHYTLVIAPNPSTSGSVAPQGDGYATVSVDTAGHATLAGRLADGTPFTSTGKVADDGSLALYAQLAGAPAGTTLEGLLHFRSTSVSDIDGSFTWTRTPNAADPYYPAGFRIDLPAAGSAYRTPTAGFQPMDLPLGGATAGLGAGDLAQPITAPVVITSSFKGAMASPGAPGIVFTINPLSGTVHGSFTLPGGKLMRALRGVVFQKQKAAYGYFRGVTECGYFSLTQG